MNILLPKSKTNISITAQEAESYLWGMAINVLVYDDNEGRRESLMLLINMQEDMRCSNTFSDCRNVWENIIAEKPDVILMDIDMPHMSGIEGVIMIRKVYPELFIVMQTVFDDTEKIFASIEAGANGYILKSATNAKLLEGIREVVEGGAPMSATIAKKVLTKLQHPVNSVKEVFELTEMERTILNLLVTGLSYKMVAAKTGVSYHTVNMHIKNIYKKLHVHSATEAIAKAMQHKIV